jgi:hypothetical protein
MAGSVRMPRRFRLLTDAEWTIVDRVFTASKLPYRWRVVITDGAGADGRPFTIPTSLLTTAAPAAFAGAVTANPLVAAAVAAPSSVIGTVFSFINAGYIMSVGPSYGDLTARHRTDQDADAAALLVHEMTHVWQGRNSRLAMTYVWESVISQCRGAISGGGTGAAYDYTPGMAWTSMNPEQQAHAVEDWFWQDGESTSAQRFSYIRDYVRTGQP